MAQQLSNDHLLRRLRQFDKMKAAHARYNKRRWAEMKLADSMRSSLEAIREGKEERDQQ